MNLDELFQEAARRTEPAVPADVIGAVRRKQAQRRRAQVLVAAPLAVLAVVAAVLLVPGGRSTAKPPGTGPSPTTSSAMPATFRGIKAGHLRSVDIASGRSTDLGPATSFSGEWVARSTGTCRSRIANSAKSFEGPTTGWSVRGAVNAMALSPDGKTLAYSRSEPAAVSDQPEYPCGNESLVLRDLATGSERVWTGDEGYVESLSWRPDSSALAFQTAVCCDADVTVKSFFVSAPVGKVSGIPDDAPGKHGEREVYPVWSGVTIDVLQERDDATWHIVTSGIGTVSADLPGEGVSLDETPDGWFLVALYGSPETPGRLLAIRKGEPVRELGTGYSQAHWAP